MDSDSDEAIAITVAACLQEQRKRKRKNVVADQGSGCSVGICMEHTTACYKSSLLNIFIIIHFLANGEMPVREIVA